MRIWHFVTAYLVGATLTFGYLYNRMPDCGPQPSPTRPFTEMNDWNLCYSNGTAGVFFGSIVWPFYVVGRVAIEVTK